MIRTNIQYYCKDYMKIENYEKAVNDTTQIWQLHHRLETHTSDGVERPKNAQITEKELKVLDMYFHRPPEEFIFLTNLDHRRLHKRGMKRTEETKEKMKVAKKGKTNVCKGRHWYTNGIKNIRTFEAPEGFIPGFSEEHKKNLSKNHKSKKIVFCHD